MSDELGHYPPTWLLCYVPLLPILLYHLPYTRVVRELLLSQKLS